jgi:hypothetical protein
VLFFIFDRSYLEKIEEQHNNFAFGELQNLFYYYSNIA